MNEIFEIVLALLALAGIVFGTMFLLFVFIIKRLCEQVRDKKLP